MNKIIVLLFLVGLNSYGQDYYWSGNGSSDDISNAGNWFSSNPNSGGNLYFNNTGDNCGFSGRKNVYVNYGSNSFFGNIITYNCSSTIRLYGDNTYAFKFENFSSPQLFELSPSFSGVNSEIGNRINSDLEINPVGSGGILVSCSKVSIDNVNGIRTLKIYGNQTLTVNASIYEKNGAGARVTLFGNGNVYLNRQNTYTGTTTINAGTLHLNREGGQTLPSGNSIVVNSGGTLRISQDQEINTITLNGGVINIDPGKTLIVNNLISNVGTINGTGDVKITGVLTVNAGLFTTNNKLTLVSNATTTARVATVAGTISGNVTVERYIQGRRAFRFLTPGVTTTSSIFQNWQNNGATTAGIGTQITGGSALNGFDQSGSNNPSLHTYNAQASGNISGYTAVSNTVSTTLKAGVGYRILVRGDRNVNLFAASSTGSITPTTISATGTLITGSVTFNSTESSPVPMNNNATNTQTNGYSLIGNPYASPVDWHAVSKNGVLNNAYYTWDPTLGTDSQRGRYVVYSQDTQTASLYDDNSALPLSNRQYLQSGQAVFVKNAISGTAATLTFDENDKVSNYGYVFRSSNDVATSTGNSTLFLTVFEPNVLALGGSPIDGALALFGSDFSNDLNEKDIDKLVSSGENIAFYRGNKNLAIETLAPVADNDELFVKTIQFQANKSYTFKINTENFDSSIPAKIIDLYSNTETELNLSQPNFVDFSTTSDANSYSSNRFKIVFGTTALANDSFHKDTISVYPNPILNNQFTIALPSKISGNVTFTMTNMLGQVVYNETLQSIPNLQILPKNQLEDGVYVVSVTSNGKKLQSKVVVGK